MTSFVTMTTSIVINPFQLKLYCISSKRVVAQIPLVYF